MANSRHFFPDYTNPAYILLLIRDGMVKTEDDLWVHFKVPELPPSISFIVRGHIRNNLKQLRDVGVVEYSDAGEIIKVTPLLEKL